MTSMLLLLLIAFGLMAFWIQQFNDLMSCPDENFPGKHDKILWVAILRALSLFGALTFWFFKRSRGKRV